MAYLHKESITIDPTKCGSSDSSNFPMLFNSTIAALKTVGNGGEVTNANGYDVMFSSADNDYAGISKLDFEIERYNASTGEYIAHVRVPTVSHSTPTVIYLYWGNALVSTSQENKTGVWDTNFVGVYHLPDGTTLNVNDSTSNAVNGTNNGGTAITGQIDGGVGFAGAQYVDLGASNAVANVNGIASIEFWVKWTGTNYNGSDQALVFTASSGAGQVNIGVYLTGNKFHMVNDPSTDITCTASISDNNWRHVVMTRSGSTGNWTDTLYINGVQDKQQTGITTNPNGSVGSVNTAIGRYGAGPFFNATAQMDEVRVSKINRPVDWYITQFNNQNSPSTFYSLGSEVTSGIFGKIVKTSFAPTRASSY